VFLHGEGTRLPFVRNWAHQLSGSGGKEQWCLCCADWETWEKANFQGVDVAAYLQEKAAMIYLD
jgi:hypothetical protein